MPRGKLNPAYRQFSDEELIVLFSEPPAIPERFSMALMLDEGVNRLAIPILLERCERLNITTVQREGLAGEKSDYRLLAYARRIACTFVVSDTGYYRIEKKLQQLNLTHAGLIFSDVTAYRAQEKLITFVEDAYQLSLEKDMPGYFHNQFWDA